MKETVKSVIGTTDASLRAYAEEVISCWENAILSLKSNKSFY